MNLPQSSFALLYSLRNPVVCVVSFVIMSLGLSRTLAADEFPVVRSFVQQYCVECHDTETKKGGLDLTALKWGLQDAKTFGQWVKVYDRVHDGEMPPKKKTQPPANEAQAFLKNIAEPMIASDREREMREGRATLRRLNRYEYENTLRDLLDAPWLQVSQMLPEDGESHRFNKSGDALDVSHVQMARYLAVADYALRQRWRRTSRDRRPPRCATTRATRRPSPAR